MREIALTVGALAGLLCVLIALAAVMFGITPLVFRSGSMSPAIETGALALSKSTPAVDIQVGDIVNVTNAAGNGITHRVVDIGAVSSVSAELFLKGDANAEPDAEPYVVSDVRRVLFSVPKLGYVVTWLSSPVAVFAGGLMVGVLLMIAWRPHGRNVPESALDDRPSGRHSKLPLSVFVALAVVGTVGIASSNPPAALAAPLSDTSTSTSGTITTALPPIPAPNSLGCNTLSRSILGIGLQSYVRLSWLSTGPSYTYRITLTRSGFTDIVIPVATTGATGATISHEITNGAILSLSALNGTYSARVQTVSGSAVSLPGPSFTIIFGVVIVLLPSAQCGTAGASARLAPQPEPATTVPTTTDPSATTIPPATTTTVPPATTTTVPPATTTTTPSTTTTTMVPTTTTSPPPPADLVAPRTSPSGSAVAKVVSVGGSPTLQITDSSGDVQYSGPISSSSEYGYGVTWASGDELWLLGPSQLVRLDGTGGGWSRSVVDPSSEEVPAEISALLN
ncbi:signal peptidase I [Rhodococcus sp. 14-2470-1b]|nr:signal peptidase I [Rhodococcus sp. 14-2470-1b]